MSKQNRVKMDLFEAVEKRRSIRKYQSKPVRKEDLKRILEAGRMAPSGSNRQPWRFIIAEKPETKKALAIAASNQMFISDAGVIVACLGDSSLSAKPPSSSTRIPSKQDPVIAIEHMVLAATALGYGTCWIGAFNEDEIKRILKVPDQFTVVALLPIGAPAETPPAKPRKPFSEIFSIEAYGVPFEP